MRCITLRLFVNVRVAYRLLKVFSELKKRMSRDPHRSSGGEFSSPVKLDRFAMRKVFVTGGPIADDGLKSMKVEGYCVLLFGNVEVYS